MARSFVQRLFTRLMPRHAAAMEADSRRWMMTCNCGFARSIWDLGGIKWTAKGESRNYGLCPSCGKRSWHRLIYRKDEAEAAGSDAAAS
jgi:hypothetical protein